jgi:Mrp family chromosome partitioning ATPase
MRGKVRYVLTSSHTSQGFHTFIPELLREIPKIYILKGAPGSGKSTFIRLLGESLSEQGYEVEFWISAADPVSPEGVFIPQLQAAVVNGCLAYPIDPRYPGLTGDIIYMGDYWDKLLIETHRQEIMGLSDEQEQHRHQATAALKSAAVIKETITKQVDAYLDERKMEQLTERLAQQILDSHPAEKHYFASAVTAEGMINYMEQISSFCQKRYVFKGPAGNGKSAVMMELAARARAMGYSLEYYHCGLDADSVQMIIILNLQIALIDAGLLELAGKPWDVVIDMSQCLEGYEEANLAQEFSASLRIYETLMLQAQQELEQSHRCLKDLKKIYAGAMDFEALDRKRQQIQREITG